MTDIPYPSRFKASHVFHDFELTDANNVATHFNYWFFDIYQFFDTHPGWSIIGQSPAAPEWTDWQNIYDLAVAGGYFPYFTIQSNYPWEGAVGGADIRQEVMFVCGTNRSTPTSYKGMSFPAYYKGIGIKYCPEGGPDGVGWFVDDFQDDAKWMYGLTYYCDGHEPISFSDEAKMIINADEKTIVMVFYRYPGSITEENIKNVSPAGTYIGAVNSPHAAVDDPYPAILITTPAAQWSNDGYNYTWGRPQATSYPTNAETDAFGYSPVGFEPEDGYEWIIYQSHIDYANNAGTGEAQGYHNTTRTQSPENFVELPIHVWLARYDEFDVQGEYWGTMRFVRNVGKGVWDGTMADLGIGRGDRSQNSVNGYKRIPISGLTYYLGDD